MTERKLNKVTNMPQLTAENDNIKPSSVDYSYLHYLKVCLWDKFFCFKGRARRKEYITFQLADLFIALNFYFAIHYMSVNAHATYIMYNIISAVLIIPLISVSVRRFHDAGFSGWWCLLGVIPLITVAFLAIKNSERSTNKYGEVPEGKTFKMPLWSNYAVEEANVVPFRKNTAPKTRRKKTAA